MSGDAYSFTSSVDLTPSFPAGNDGISVITCFQLSVDLVSCGLRNEFPFEISMIFFRLWDFPTDWLRDNSAAFCQITFDTCYDFYYYLLNGIFPRETRTKTQPTTIVTSPQSNLRRAASQKPIRYNGTPQIHSKTAPSSSTITTPIEYTHTSTDLTHHPKRHLDPISRFATIHFADTHTNRDDPGECSTTWAAYAR